MPLPVAAVVRGALGRLRYPRLLLLTGVLFVADLVVPDLIPFADEVLLGLGTLVLAGLRNRRAPDAEAQR